MSTSWQREVPTRPLLSGGYDTCGRWRRRLAIPPPAGVRQKPVESAYRRRLRLQLAVAAVVVVAGAAAPVAAAAPAAAAAVGLWWRAASVGRSRATLVAAATRRARVRWLAPTSAVPLPAAGTCHGRRAPRLTVRTVECA